ncbi:hypothetical protein GGR01_003622 [Acetobacter oeni]|nr:hypothetical protein [Acetobacter oeni]
MCQQVALVETTRASRALRAYEAARRKRRFSAASPG